MAPWVIPAPRDPRQRHAQHSLTAPAPVSCALTCGMPPRSWSHYVQNWGSRGTEKAPRACLRLEAIADVSKSVDIDGPARVRLKLRSERSHAPIDAAWCDEDGVAPDCVEDHVA
jgi:hypothetical protein